MSDHPLPAGVDANAADVIALAQEVIGDLGLLTALAVQPAAR